MYIISSKCVVQIKLTCQNNPSFCHALTSLNRSATFFLSPCFKLLASKKQEGDWASVKFIYRSIPSKEERESLLALPHTFFGWCWQNLHSRTKMFWFLHLNWKGNCINRYLCWEQHSSFYKPIRSTKKDSPSISTQHQSHSTQAKKQYLPPSSSTILCSFLLATICLVSQCSMSFWMDISTGEGLGEHSFPFTPFSYTTHSLAGELLTAQTQPDACPYQHFPHRGEEDPGHVQYSGKSHSFPQRDHSTTLIRQQQVHQLSLWRVHICTHRGIAHMMWSDWCSSDTWPEHIHFGHALEELTIFSAWRTCAETPRRRGTECPLAIPSMPSAAAPLEVSTTDVMALLQTVRPIAFSLTNLSKPLLQNPPLALL